MKGLMKQVKEMKIVFQRKKMVTTVTIENPDNAKPKMNWLSGGFTAAGLLQWIANDVIGLRILEYNEAKTAFKTSTPKRTITNGLPTLVIELQSKYMMVRKVNTKQTNQTDYN